VSARHRAPIRYGEVAEAVLVIVLLVSWVAGFTPSERGGWLGIPWLVAAIGLVTLSSIQWLLARVRKDDKPAAAP
jgi:protein-S-isoprenylcysteine O-methyltransferase Ste14